MPKLPPQRLLVLATLACLLGGPLGCAELERLRAENTTLERRLAELERENKKFQENYYTIKSMLDETEAEGELEKAELRRQIEQAREQTTEREAQLAADLEDLQKQYDALRRDVSADVALSEVRVGQLQQQLEEAIEQRDEARSRLQALAARDTTDDERITALNARIDALRRDLDARAERIDELQARLTAAEQEREEALEEVRALKSGGGELQQELEAARNARQAAEARAKERTGELEAARAQLAEAEARLAEKEAQLKQQIEAHQTELKTARAEAAAEALAARSPTRDRGLIDAAAALRKTLETRPGNVRVRLDASGLRIIMPTAALFEPDSTLLSSEGEALLDAVASTLTDLRTRPIRSEGHGDERGVGDLPFADNWRLSYAWADSVRAYLLQLGALDPARVTAAARAEFDPLEDAGRTRRVEIVIGRAD